MDDHNVVFVGIDTSKSSHAVATASAGRDGEVRFWGEISSDEAAVRKLVKRLKTKASRLVCCYEAGPTGYGLYRLLLSLGCECSVVAPSQTPRKPGDRVKTNRRDALSLARLLRAGELTPVWVPDERHEAMRDLARTRASVAQDRRVKRQQIGALLLRLGRIYPRQRTWRGAHLAWLRGQKFEHWEQRFAFEELLGALHQAEERLKRLEEAMRQAFETWSLAPQARALMAMRGFDFLSATTFYAEAGDLSRFAHPRDLMGWLGLTPAESSTGAKTRRMSITKAGNKLARKTLIESAWSYRYPARVNAKKAKLIEKASPEAAEIAWKAQTRLAARYRKLLGSGKRSTVAVTAVARECAGFIWALDRSTNASARKPD